MDSLKSQQRGGIFLSKGLGQCFRIVGTQSGMLGLNFVFGAVINFQCENFGNVLFRKAIFDNFCRIPADNSIRRHIFGHNASCCNNGAFAQSDPRPTITMR